MAYSVLKYKLKEFLELDASGEIKESNKNILVTSKKSADPSQALTPKVDNLCISTHTKFTLPPGQRRGT